MNTVQAAIEAAVDVEIRNGGLFTAHDITVKVRNAGLITGHDEVRDIVHDYYGRGGMDNYSRTNISVPGGNPLLYHPVGVDPSSYSGIRGGSPVKNSVVAIPAFLPDVEDDEDDEDEDPTVGGGGLITAKPKINLARNSRDSLSGRKVDKRGSLSIPSSVVRVLGCKTGDTVYAVKSSGAIEIYPEKQPEAVSYTVDCNGQVRITQPLLVKAGIGGEKYDIAEAGKVVKIKLAK